ncbi:putative cyclin dependent kinase-binding protein [Trypanosoma cruzi]|nr:putative cyclin dependent kinase-binding protein [Trypanosoma cruzi]
MNTSHGGHPLRQEELARTTAALMGLCVKPPLAMEGHPSNSGDDNSNGAERQSKVCPSIHAQQQQSASESPNTLFSNSSVMDNASSLSSAAIPPAPLPTTVTSSFYPEQVAFLTSVGEMAKRLALQRKPTHRGEGHGNAHHGIDMDLPFLRQGEAPLSVKTLVRGEGQRVRLRLALESQMHQQNQGSQNKNCGNTAAKQKGDSLKDNGDAGRSLSAGRRAAGVQYNHPASLCTILSCFAPLKASYWQDDRLVEPYLGECYDPDPQRRRGNRSDENTVIERGEDGGAGGEELDDDSCSVDINDKTDSRSDCESHDGSDRLRQRRGHSEKAMRSYGKMLTHNRCRNDPVFHDAFFLDTGNITGGERRKKLIVLQSYRASVISFVDMKVLKKDINNDFYIQHPELEIREIKLTHLRKIRAALLNFALEDNSPIEVVTVAHANWYFERLVMRGMVGKRNCGLAVAACILLAVKFIETGDIHKKIQYVKTRFRQDEAFASLTWQKVQEWEFRAYVGLEFTLMPENGNQVVEAHLERLLGQINLTSQEYYSKKFALP